MSFKIGNDFYLGQYTRRKIDDEVHHVLHSIEVEEITEGLRLNLAAHLKLQFIFPPNGKPWFNRGL